MPLEARIVSAVPDAGATDVWENPDLPAELDARSRTRAGHVRRGSHGVVLPVQDQNLSGKSLRTIQIVTLQPAVEGHHAFYVIAAGPDQVKHRGTAKAIAHRAHA